eukprot:CAMPEP_0202685470 /NCGR_PEP_ID=MMETSP1385-20130828/1228_1 /ASSEMBLY_ACC=CAM_ASM_000861 /TAXON_ID=933848 /ORGANISM="Elphidium margaritaceum" /LENGTH=434 /DNA_ID=CAMNT_0049339823 /DNA_START=138 /DNA_END=1442 /DNA_ORIENTATION=+
MPTKVDKKPKDPNAPKKPQTSYFIYSNERRAALQKEHGKSVTEISKYISAEWKEMDADTKKGYEDKALTFKEKYNTDMEEYKQTEQYRTHQERLKQWQQIQKDKAAAGDDDDAASGGKKSPRKSNSRGKPKPPKKPKQPEAMPRRPASAYFIFSNERRNELKDQYPDKKVTELATLIGGEWKLKSAEEKKVYEDQAGVLKEKYLEGMKTYKPTDEYKEYLNELDAWKQAKKRFEAGQVDSDDDDKVAMPRKPKDAKMPKRPLSSYFLFAAAVREQTKSEFPNLPVTQIAKEISKKWNVLSEEDKKPYNEEAARLKEVYEKAISVYRNSDAQKDYQLVLDEWKAECSNRRTAAKRKKEKQKAAEDAKTKAATKKPSKKAKGKGKKKKMDTDSDDDDDSDSDDSSSSGSSSGSDSDSGSSSSGSTASDSDSDSDSD